jgi:hypothetical protein
MARRLGAVLTVCTSSVACTGARPSPPVSVSAPGTPPIAAVSTDAGTTEAAPCTQHIAPVPGPDYPAFTTSCVMPELPPGYPVPRPLADRPWQEGDAAVGPLSVKDPKNITKLLAGLKAYVAPVFDAYIADPTNATTRPDAHGWRMMPWLGGSSCADEWSGRESAAGTSTGQVIPAGTLPGQKSAGEQGDLQNHSITWYDPWGAYALSSVFGAPTPGTANPRNEQMADGTVIVKMAVLTPYADGTHWPTVASAPAWPVYRPPVGQSTNYYCGAPSDHFQLLSTRLIQFDIILKSSYYAPETGWVFATWLFDPNAQGSGPLDHFTPLGAMWGNDPGVAQTDLCTPVRPLQQNWINPAAPAYGYQQLGWGCRLSGPIDVSRRQVAFEDGSSCATARVSSCMSCHGTASGCSPRARARPPSTR